MRLGFVMALGVGSWLAADALISAGALAQEDVERFTDGDATHGEALYMRYCRGCHGEDGRGGAHTFMPHIENLTKKEYIEFMVVSRRWWKIRRRGSEGMVVGIRRRSQGRWASARGSASRRMAGEPPISSISIPVVSRNMRPCKGSNWRISVSNSSSS